MSAHNFFSHFVKVLFFSFILSAFSMAHAGVDTRGLDAEQLNKLEAYALAMKKEGDTSKPADVAKTVREEVSAWADLGKNVGIAMVGAAKELGVAANEFASTDLGRIVTFIIVFKMVGLTFIKLLVGGFVLLFGVSFGVWLVRTERWSNTTYKYVPTLFGLYQKRVADRTDYNRVQVENQILIGSIAILASILLSLAIIFS